VQTNADQCLAQLFKRDVLALFPDSKNVRPPVFYSARAPVAALRLRSKAAGIAPLCLPADRRRRCHTKANCRCTAAHPFINRRQKPPAKIHRKWLAHPCRPPSPARILNQKTQPEGIPFRFRQVENRSKRHATADEVASLVLYLASPAAAMITGTTQTIDGGVGI
jgi:NAD(P)-dependent dehydrogenase (short-subunit alcohol dehydrogenase family)